MDHVEALNAIKVYKERMQFVDKAMEALAASAELTMDADNKVKALKKEQTALSNSIARLQADMISLESQKKAAGFAHEKQVTEMLARYEALTKEEVDKYEALKAEVREPYEKLVAEVNAEKAALSVELAELRDKVRVAKDELKAVKDARKKLLQDLGVANG